MPLKIDMAQKDPTIKERYARTIELKELKEAQKGRLIVHLIYFIGLNERIINMSYSI